MKVIKYCSFFLFCLGINSTVLATEEINFRVIQANVQLPTITTWVDITDSNGRKLAIVKPEQLTATMGANVAEVKTIKPFSEEADGTAFIFLVDISKSLKPTHFGQIQAALNAWVAGLNAHDRAALISFGSQVKVLQDFSDDKTALKQKVDSLSPSDKDTFLYQGLVKAFELGRRQDVALPKRRVIVVLTDGIDDAAGGVTKEELSLQMSESRTPIYAIGFALSPLTQLKENGLKELGVLARTSGGYFLKADSMPLSAAYKLQKERIANSYEVQLNCDACKAEGQFSHLNMTFNAGDLTLNDGLDLRLLPQNKVITPEKKPELRDTEKTPDKITQIFTDYGYFAWVALATIFLLVVVGVRRFIKAKRTSPERRLEADVSANIGESEQLKQVTPLPSEFTLSLTVVTGDAPGKSYNLNFNESAIIGRSSSCDLSIDDSEVSSKHVEISFERGILAIKDLGSMNGTLINGVPIYSVHYLQEGDQILIGRTELRLNGLEDKYAH